MNSNNLAVSFYAVRYSKLWGVALICLCFSFAGCGAIGKSIKATVAPETADWPTRFKEPCADASCTKNEATMAFNESNDYCRKVQNYYESQGFRTSGAKLSIGVLGTLAGAVFAPISTGSAATAWSGLSGATNGMQTSFDEAFSTQMIVKYRAAVVSAAAEGVAEYRKHTDPNEKVEAAISMARSCSMASALAELQTLKAISQDPIVESGKKTNSPPSAAENGDKPPANGAGQ